GPLRGAHVQLLPLDPGGRGERRTTDTDSAGRYVIDGVAAGRYLTGFFHPRLDSLGLDPPSQRVDVRAVSEQELDFAVPSPATVIASWCGREAARDAGVILGYVRDVASTSLLEGATVAARWSAITLGAGGARAGVQETTTRTNATGWFGLCGVPRGAVLLMHAVSDPDSSALLELDVPEHGLLLRDITLQRRATAPTVTPVVTGSVRDASGQPLAGARVRLWGSSIETRTDGDGEFRFGTRNAGTQLVDARMIGFVPTRRVVDVSPTAGARVELTLADFPLEIDTVRVLAARARRPGSLAGFEHRRRLGHGTFLDPDQVEIRRPLVFTDLLRGMPGVDIRTVDMMTRAIQMRGVNGTACTPALVVDGMRLPLVEMNIDDVIPADLVKALEVYPRRIQAPPEYQTMDCGSVVVWTGVRGWLARQLKDRPPARPHRP
ncbi:MAG: carboxypeptidase regulatory-like domain-containing protein, partial [Cytophagaceae bacterium]|nr:carboxypeptidase regulatory-like domain-containing protein [Gemmatimonadaceae bacterium]